MGAPTPFSIYEIILSSYIPFNFINLMIRQSVPSYLILNVKSLKMTHNIPYMGIYFY